MTSKIYFYYRNMKSTETINSTIIGKTKHFVDKTEPHPTSYEGDSPQPCSHLQHLPQSEDL